MPDRAYFPIIHEYLSIGDLSRVDCSLKKSQAYLKELIGAEYDSDEEESDSR
jgi:hypothetical protein